MSRFDCVLIEDGQGGYQVKFILKQGVPSTVGIAYAADRDTNSSELDLINSGSSLSQQSRPFTLWVNRNRGNSLQNRIDCDEIVRQFLDVTFDDSMVIDISENQSNDAEETAKRNHNSLNL